jgi:hypothetical protein
VTPLRQRFIKELQLRNRSPKTIEAYVFHVKELARYFGRSPDLLVRRSAGSRVWPASVRTLCGIAIALAEKQRRDGHDGN